MPPALPEPTRRTNILLFAADCEQLERRYGRGWTEQVRLMVRQNCKNYDSLKATLDDEHG